MARRTATRHRQPGRVLRLALLPVVLVLAVGLAPAAAGAQEASTAPTLSELLAGDVAGLTAGATVGALDVDGLELRVVNAGSEPVEVAIPFGTLVATDDEGDQTLAVGPEPTPEVAEVAAAGDTPTIVVEPGNNSYELAVYCTELGDGFPSEPTVVHALDPAHQVLADTLRQATAEQASHSTTQGAVWWLTDEPFLPVDGEYASLLADVDTAGFAADPFRVVPDTGYDPLWMDAEVSPPSDGGSIAAPADDEEAAGILDESFDGGPASPVGSTGDGGSSVALWVVLVGIVAVGTVIVATRAGRGRPQAATAPALAAGWYPDPMGSGHRYWDGQTWTGRTLP